MGSRERKTLENDRMKKCVGGQGVIFGSNESGRLNIVDSMGDGNGDQSDTSAR